MWAIAAAKSSFTWWSSSLACCRLNTICKSIRHQFFIISNKWFCQSSYIMQIKQTSTPRVDKNNQPMKQPSTHNPTEMKKKKKTNKLSFEERWQRKKGVPPHLHHEHLPPHWLYSWCLPRPPLSVREKSLKWSLYHCWDGPNIASGKFWNKHNLGCNRVTQLQNYKCSPSHLPSTAVPGPSIVPAKSICQQRDSISIFLTIVMEKI